MASSVQEPSGKIRGVTPGRVVHRYEWAERDGRQVPVAEFKVIRVPFQPGAIVVRRLHKHGMNVKEIVARTGYSQQHVWRILHGKKSGRE